MARRIGRTEVEVIIEAIERRLLDERLRQAGRRPLPRSIGIVNAPDVSGADYEEWLAANWKPDWE